MVEYLPRSAWKARPAKSGPGSLTPSRVQGTVIHWPGTTSSKPITSKAAVASALRGWQAFHMDDRDWSDIAYQVAVDQEGRAWTLRGLRTQSGANGNNDLNERYGAILLVLVQGEKPSAAMTATVRGVIADFRRIFPRGTAIKPHGAVRPDGTDCPGPAAKAALARGDFTPGTTTPPEEDDDMTPAQQKMIEDGFAGLHSRIDVLKDEVNNYTKSVDFINDLASEGALATLKEQINNFTRSVDTINDAANASTAATLLGKLDEVKTKLDALAAPAVEEPGAPKA